MNYDSRVVRSLAGLGLLVVGGYGFRAGVRSVISGIERTGRVPWWLPDFGSVGQTVLVVLLTASLVTYVVIPVLAFALGYRSGNGTAG